MRVLIACEFSGILREAFTKEGNHSVSCDLLDTEIPPSEDADHYQGNVEDILTRSWDLMVAHPPCTYLAVSGARWFKQRKPLQERALSFVKKLMDAPIEKICVENPVSVLSTRIRKPDQIIQPWQFGHGETKATCLWLKNLPKLESTIISVEREHLVWKESPSIDRWKNRSRTYPGIAEAMASQWSISSLYEVI